MTRFFTYLVVGGVVLGIAGAAYVFWPTTDGSMAGMKMPTAEAAQASDIRTVTPTISKNFSTLLLVGTVQSYETAKIASRSEGIVSDVYAEVGDAVTAGQTLVTLLPHGVEGQASAEIAEVSAMRDVAKANYDNAVRMAEAVRNRSRTNLDTTKITQIASVAMMERSVSVSQASLTAAESALARVKETRDARLEAAANAVNQTADQTVIASYSAYEMVAADLVPDRNASAQGVTSNQLSSNYGALDTNSRQIFINSFNAATQKKVENAKLDQASQRANVENLISTMAQLLTDSEALLRKSISDAELAQSRIDDKLKDIHEAQKDLLEARQMFTKEIAERATMQKEEDADVAAMENEVNEKKAMVAETESNLTLRKKEQTRETEMAQKELAEAAIDRDADVNKMRAELAASEAALAAKLAESGHAVIKAATSGTIAKRLITVGDQVMANQAVFEIVDAKTALARRAQAVVQFGAPEELFPIVSEGDAVEIVVPGSSLSSYKATITGKGAQIDPMSRTFTLLATLADDTILPPNANVRVRVAAEKNPAWQIPARAVKRMDSMNHVWAMKDGKPQQITLEVLAEDGEFADVKSSELTADTTIVIDPPESFLTTDMAGGNSTSAAPMAGHNH